MCGSHLNHPYDRSSLLHELLSKLAAKVSLALDNLGPCEFETARIERQLSIDESLWMHPQLRSGIRPSRRMPGQAIPIVGSVVPAHQPWPEPYGLPCSAARVAGKNGPSVRRAFGHSASPRRRAWRPGLPASRARPSPAAPPDCALVCFGPRPKRSRRSIRLPRPVGPFACSGRANLPSKHTHMSAEAYPPDGPQISPRQGSQNFSAGAEPVARDGPVRVGAPVSGAARGKLLRPASRRLRRP